MKLEKPYSPDNNPSNTDSSGSSSSDTDSSESTRAHEEYEEYLEDIRKQTSQKFNEYESQESNEEHIDGPEDTTSTETSAQVGEKSTFENEGEQIDRNFMSKLKGMGGRSRNNSPRGETEFDTTTTSTFDVDPVSRSSVSSDLPSFEDGRQESSLRSSTFENEGQERLEGVKPGGREKIARGLGQARTLGGEAASSLMRRIGKTDQSQNQLDFDFDDFNPTFKQNDQQPQGERGDEVSVNTENPAAAGTGARKSGRRGREGRRGGKKKQDSPVKKHDNNPMFDPNSQDATTGNDDADDSLRVRERAALNPVRRGGNRDREAELNTGVEAIIGEFPDIQTGTITSAERQGQADQSTVDRLRRQGAVYTLDTQDNTLEHRLADMSRSRSSTGGGRSKKIIKTKSKRIKNKYSKRKHSKRKKSKHKKSKRKKSIKK